MGEASSLESLQALYADLLALSESRLTNLERLGAQLNAHVEDLRNLLDKKARSDHSRKSLTTGKLEILGEEYTINKEFQQDTLKLADELDLDELEAGKLFLEAQNQTEVSGGVILTNAVIRFHQRGKYVLDCIRLLLQLAANVDLDESLRDDLQQILNDVVGSEGESSRFPQKCLSTMNNIRSWVQSLAEKLNGASVLGQRLPTELEEVVEFQRVSLVKQHESVGSILLYLVKANHSIIEDFDVVLDTLKKSDKYDNLLIHYFPVLSAYITRFGGIEGNGTMAEARSLNDKYFGEVELSSWKQSYVHGAFRVLWLAEYSSWYGENFDGSIPDDQLETEARQRAKRFGDALKDGAFEFILAISADVKSADWQDPARQGLRSWLQKKLQINLPDSTPFSDFFQALLMEQLENFVEAFILNLPDVLRKLRVDEDEQRQLSKEHEHDIDLEKFLVIISYTYEKRPKAALEGFWDDPDGALRGFIQWASRRASTPLVSAFCEMLQSLSEDEECATAAHELLLDDGPQSSGKMRRTHSLTWNQIFKELQYFHAKIRDRLSHPQSQPYRGGNYNSALAEDEPESALMLECYLRLISKLCSESPTARSFLSNHPSFHISELLFQLASCGIGSRLRACALNTLRSLLCQKTKAAGEWMWTSIESWMTGSFSGTITSKSTSAPVIPSLSAITDVLKALDSGFEEPNSFVQLLTALVLPYEEDSTLHDGLNFPEHLGSGSRMPGIEPYVDFAVGKVFASRTHELTDRVQSRLLRLSCLEFIHTCLDTFNEDLVVFASQSSVSVDTAIQASNLTTYVLIHPFSRVMEWMLSENVMTALFATVHQDQADVMKASPDSPLILCLLRGIQVLISILDLQPTYLDIVRPLVKRQSSQRRNMVSNTAFASFEDGILNHLSVVADLGLYCGAGHPDLVIASLKLLQKLSALPKLSSTPTAGLARGLARNKALAALEDDADAISSILVQQMSADIDINSGAESHAYIIKLEILDFLIECLRASPGQPSIAHRLLGFACSGERLSIDGKSSFARGVSLFHAVLTLVTDGYPMVTDFNLDSWLVSLNHKGQQVLKELWLAPLSSALVLEEMRLADSFFLMFAKEIPVQSGFLWDGLDMSDPAFLMASSAPCLTEYLARRTLLLRYLSTELRQVARGHSPSLKQRIFDTLLGSTTVEGDQKINHATIFDLYDSTEPEFGQPSMPVLPWFTDFEMRSCQLDLEDPLSQYDLKKVEELLLLRRSELINSNRLNSQDLSQYNVQAEELFCFYIMDNRVKLLQLARLDARRAWVQLTLVMVESHDFDSTTKTAFVLRVLQTIIPRLDGGLGNIPEATELAKLAKALVFSLDFRTDSFKQGDMGEMVSDRLFHLFQVSLRAINILGAHSRLKEMFYNISYRYLAGMSDVAGISRVSKRHSVQTIKSAGERLIDTICDDAYAGESNCRIAALLLLGTLVKMGNAEKSKYIIEALVRLNFVSILVESIQKIPSDLRDTSIPDVDMHLSYCHARLSLLLNISQTRHGSTATVNSGLFYSIKASGLFAVDPDLGVDIEGPGAVNKHYELLASIMRLICAAILSRGIQNEQTLDLGRKFLTENRLSILAVLKKSAGLGSRAEVSRQSIEDLAESFMLLISVTNFLEFEDQVMTKQQPLKAFT